VFTELVFKDASWDNTLDTISVPLGKCTVAWLKHVTLTGWDFGKPLNASAFEVSYDMNYKLEMSFDYLGK
jgi:hypothetical protein